MSWKKSTSKILCETHHFFKCTLSFLCQFLLFSSSTPIPKWRTCWMVPIKIHNIVMGGILCDAEIILLFNTSWLASLRTWCLALDFLSFSCSGYDLMLISKSHTLNCYSLLLKLILKTKTYKVVAGDCGCSICY